MSDIGVIVMLNGVVGNNTHRPLDIEEFRAFAMVDDFAPLIFINSTDSQSGRLFSLLHEFAHLCLGRDSLFNGTNVEAETNATEKLCNAVAGELLVPHSVFKPEWMKEKKNNTEDSENTIEALTRHFKCGASIIARRALDEGLIDKALYKKITMKAIELYRENRKNKSSGGSYYNTALAKNDTRFLRSLMNSVAEGSVCFSDAYRLTNTNRSTFKELTRRLGG